MYTYLLVITCPSVSAIVLSSAASSQNLEQNHKLLGKYYWLVNHSMWDYCSFLYLLTLLCCLSSFSLDQ